LSLQAHAVSRHPANIVGDADGRGAITVLGPKIGLSPAEITQIRSAVGHFVCPGTDHGNEFGGTAFLISHDVIITVAHAFFDDKGIQRSPWNECYFQTQDGRSQRVKIADPLTDPNAIQNGSSSPIKDRWSDYAVVKLSAPIPSLPLTVVEQEMEVSPWSPIFQVASHRDEPYYKGESQGEPLVQTCNVRISFPKSKKFPAIFYSDCDNTEGGSGGLNLIRLKNGQLVVAGVVNAGGLPDQDYKPYNDLLPVKGQKAKYSLSYSLQISGPLLNAVQNALSSKVKMAELPVKTSKAVPRARSGVSSGFIGQ
jgi:hypothetical protein